MEKNEMKKKKLIEIQCKITINGCSSKRVESFYLKAHTAFTNGRIPQKKKQSFYIEKK